MYRLQDISRDSRKKPRLKQPPPYIGDQALQRSHKMPRFIGAFLFLPLALQLKIKSMPLFDFGEIHFKLYSEKNSNLGQGK